MKPKFEKGCIYINTYNNGESHQLLKIKQIHRDFFPELSYSIVGVFRKGTDLRGLVFEHSERYLCSISFKKLEQGGKL